MLMKTCMKRMGVLRYSVLWFIVTLMTCKWNWICLTFQVTPGKLTNYCEHLTKAQGLSMGGWVGGAQWGEVGAFLLLPTVLCVRSVLKIMTSMGERIEFVFYRTLYSLALERREVSVLLKKLHHYLHAHIPCFYRISSWSKTCYHTNSIKSTLSGSEINFRYWILFPGAKMLKFGDQRVQFISKFHLYYVYFTANENKLLEL